MAIPSTGPCHWKEWGPGLRQQSNSRAGCWVSALQCSSCSDSPTPLHAHATPPGRPVSVTCFADCMAPHVLTPLQVGLLVPQAESGVCLGWNQPCPAGSGIPEFIKLHQGCPVSPASWE